MKVQSASRDDADTTHPAVQQCDQNPHAACAMAALRADVRPPFSLDQTFYRMRQRHSPERSRDHLIRQNHHQPDNDLHLAPLSKTERYPMHSWNGNLCPLYKGITTTLIRNSRHRLFSYRAAGIPRTRVTIGRRRYSHRSPRGRWRRNALRASAIACGRTSGRSDHGENSDC